MEYALVTENYQTDAIGTFDIFSLAPTATYYFTKFKIRPFVGLGAAMYHVMDHNPIINFGIRPLWEYHFLIMWRLVWNITKY